MGYDYQLTHQKILESAMKHFTEVGFRDASIRNICHDAGVTNGAFYVHFKSKEELFSALVDETINGFMQAYDGYADFEVYSKEDLVRMFSSSYSSIEVLLHYVYKHGAQFQLVLKCSQGTVYEDFIDRMVSEETRNTMKYLESCGTFMEHPENISDRIAEIFADMAIRHAFDAFVRGVPEEVNVRETRLASNFCIAGYRDVLGF
jgi:AcrR family transcriptional regulator